MPFNVQDFRAQMTGDGARSNLFEVQLNLPTAIQNLNVGNSFSQKLIFSAHTTLIPGATLGQVPMNYFGRIINFAGNRTFTEWTVSVWNDEDFLVRSTIEAWMGSINSHVSNVRDSRLLSPNDYVSDGSVLQYSKIGGTEADAIASYRMLNCWPTDLSPIQLDWGANDTVEEYDITFAFDEWVMGQAQDFPA